METKVLAIDLAKSSFQLFGLDSKNQVSLDKKVGRSRFPKIIKSLESCTIYMEACGGAHYWARLFRFYGHEVKLIAPHHVRPFVGHQKNDRNDAKAILEACRRPEAVFVGVKSILQQDIQTLHKVRELKLKHQVAVINHIRGILLEYGIALPKSHSKFREEARLAIEDSNSELSETIRESCLKMLESYQVLNSEVAAIDQQLNEISQRYRFTIKAQEEIKGVGPLIATRFFASIGEVDNFKSGRQVSAWLGLVPKQNSTGGRSKLGRISKHGDSELRQLTIQGARSVVLHAGRKKDFDEVSKKAYRLHQEKGFNVASVAIANQNIRKMFGILKKYKNEECASKVEIERQHEVS